MPNITFVFRRHLRGSSRQHVHTPLRAHLPLKTCARHTYHHQSRLDHAQLVAMLRFTHLLQKFHASRASILCTSRKPQPLHKTLGNSRGFIICRPGGYGSTTPPDATKGLRGGRKLWSLMFGGKIEHQMAERKRNITLGKRKAKPKTFKHRNHQNYSISTNLREK